MRRVRAGGIGHASGRSRSRRRRRSRSRSGDRNGLRPGGGGRGLRLVCCAAARWAAWSCCSCWYALKKAISLKYVASCCAATALEYVASFATFWAWAYDMSFESIFTALCWLIASCRVTRAEAAGVLLNNAKSNAGKTMTATAVASAMRIRTAPPFVGRVVAPGSARCRRAPAIAFAPRTESGKASSVLADRRRVCGRLCTALGGGSGVVLDSWSRRCLRAGAPGPWSVWIGPIGRLLPVCSRNFAHGMHAKGRYEFAVSNLSVRVTEPAVRLPAVSLTWGFIQGLCDTDHKVPGREPRIWVNSGHKYSSQFRKYVPDQYQPDQHLKGIRPVRPSVRRPHGAA